jgi:hypothetical protein
LRFLHFLELVQHMRGGWCVAGGRPISIQLSPRKVDFFIYLPAFGRSKNMSDAHYFQYLGTYLIACDEEDIDYLEI